MKRHSKKSLKTAKQLIALGLGMLMLAIIPENRHSDSYIRDRIVLLSSRHGSCTGEQIHAPSGIDYILSAAHCRILEDNGFITVTTESGRILQRRVIAEDIHSDLLLLEGIPNLRGLNIANKAKRADKVTTFTRGSGMPTYKTEGVIIADIQVQVGIKELESFEDTEACEAMPKNKAMNWPGEGEICVLVVPETASTAQIVPGSSGGALLNSSRELIGVASASDSGGRFGYFVRLVDIQNFLQSY